MKNEVIITGRSAWDRGIVLTGAKLVIVHSLQELESAINEKTAMMECAYGETAVPLKEAIAICKQRGVPFMLDGAATCPPFERLKTLASFGADMFCVSGGKGLQGPQCSGLLFGRKDLIEAALHNGSPFEGSICRPMKVGKEEIVGALAAVEWSSKRDYAADCKVWEGRLGVIAKAVQAVPGVEAEIYYRKMGNEVPHLAVRWDEEAFGLTKQQCIEALRTGIRHRGLQRHGARLGEAHRSATEDGEAEDRCQLRDLDYFEHAAARRRKARGAASAGDPEAGFRAGAQGVMRSAALTMR